MSKYLSTNITYATFTPKSEWDRGPYYLFCYLLSNVSLEVYMCGLNYSACVIDLLCYIDLIEVSAIIIAITIVKTSNID